ncbi:hypothetical protein BH10PSE12_BH10PSE12_28180 [soil metagenome]
MTAAFLTAGLSLASIACGATGAVADNPPLLSAYVLMTSEGSVEHRISVVCMTCRAMLRQRLVSSTSKVPITWT